MTIQDLQQALPRYRCLELFICSLLFLFLIICFLRIVSVGIFFNNDPPMEAGIFVMFNVLLPHSFLFVVPVV